MREYIAADVFGACKGGRAVDLGRANRHAARRRNVRAAPRYRCAHRCGRAMVSRTRRGIRLGNSRHCAFGDRRHCGDEAGARVVSCRTRDRRRRDPGNQRLSGHRDDRRGCSVMGFAARAARDDGSVFLRFGYRRRLPDCAARLRNRGRGVSSSTPIARCRTCCSSIFLPPGRRIFRRSPRALRITPRLRSMQCVSSRPAPFANRMRYSR